MLMLQQMVILFILMMIGFIGFKINLIDDYTNKKLSGIVVNIANPALIISGALSNHDDISVTSILRVASLAVIIFAVLIIISYVIPLIIRAERNDYGLYRAMLIFSNIGFMGLPIISSLYGSSSLLYASIFLIPYNLLIYTYGILLIKKKDDNGKIKIKIKEVLNIGVLACIVMIIIYAFNIKLPQWCVSTITNLSNLTAPLSMFVIGSSLAMINFKQIFCDVKLIVFTLIKLIIIPVAGMFILKIFIHDEVINGICLVMLSTPVGSMNAMLAREYDGNYELASRGVALTTILSVATLPLVSLIVGI